MESYCLCECFSVGFARFCLALLGFTWFETFAWLCLALLGFTWFETFVGLIILPKMSVSSRRGALLGAQRPFKGEDLFSWRKDPALLVPPWGKNERLVEARRYCFAKMSVSSRRGAPFGAQRPFKREDLFSWRKDPALLATPWGQNEALLWGAPMGCYLGVLGVKMNVSSMRDAIILQK